MQWVTQNAVPLIGAAVIIITVIFIAVGRTVTNGHAIVLAAGAILLALPSVANFEWSSGVLKYTRRGETLDLTAKLEKLAQDNAQANAALTTVNEALKVANERISQLETMASKRGDGSTGSALPNTSNWGVFSQPAFYEKLVKGSQAATTTSKENLDSIQEFRNSLSNWPPSSDSSKFRCGPSNRC
ncbi:hypothetical protein PMI09_02449 [Rhizobium sp. CF122]|uniref:hypothetical protein n=1 Tax=Rhizobium sp. CF122 TaxID=1144312 RepID=UPI0002717DA9|nr:hypothetical protein [Rhizobium sp. CF122]EJL54358.1 hypothetical protein PMI09_02449 [Rhizobium sp. CF122]